MNIADDSIIQENDENINRKLNDTVPKMVSINTKLFFLLIGMVVVIIAQGFWLNAANKRAEVNTEVVFVKMYPNGTWDVEYRKSGEEADFFKLTIDKLLIDFVEARYGIDPNSMRRNYGFAMTFMAPTLQQSFIGTGEKDFNAAEKAEEFTSRGWSEEVHVRFLDHFDVSEGSFVQGNSDIYRTNVFIERTIRNRDGQLQEIVKEVITLHWRIKPVSTLNKLTQDELRANPIGIEIIKEKIVPDYSTEETSK